jgi:hypothetical protein
MMVSQAIDPQMSAAFPGMSFSILTCLIGAGTPAANIEVALRPGPRQKARLLPLSARAYRVSAADTNTATG